ncbi:MAG: YbaN family protein [Pseudomonadota bacterium]
MKRLEQPPFRRALLKLLGSVFVVLGAAGVVVPLLPTTPFLILAAACFARSSDQLHQWLLSNPTFGPLIENWERNRCIPRAAKRTAFIAMAVVGSSSLVFVVEGWWLRGAGFVLLAIGCITVWLIPSCPEHRQSG